MIDIEKILLHRLHMTGGVAYWYFLGDDFQSRHYWSHEFYHTTPVFDDNKFMFTKVWLHLCDKQEKVD